MALSRIAIFLLTLVVVGGGVVAFATAADPDEGTVSIENPRTQWQGKQFDGGAPVVSRELCDVAETGFCDEFTLTAEIDPIYWRSNQGGAQVGIQWEDPNDDFDLYVLDQNGEEVGSSANGGTTSERVLIDEANRGEGPYRVVVNAYDVDAGSSYTGGVLVETRADAPAPDADVPTEPISDKPCVNGVAGGVFPCKGVDLQSLLPIADLNFGETTDATGDPIELNDNWGWTDSTTGKEYAIVAMTIGTAFVDISDPQRPKFLGRLLSSQRVLGTAIPAQKIWRDVKVYKDHAYIVSEEPTHGMQVFDLARLREADPADPQAFEEDSLYTRTPPLGSTAAPNPDAMGNSHNIAINEESGFAYVIGTDTCSAGLHIIDLKDPKNPQFAGCFAEDGYTHDTQCVNYRGPDAKYVGKEICFSSNEDTLTITDVTDKANTVQLSRTPYDGFAYSHQGWLTEDGKSFLLNDELDEQESGKGTTTRVFDVENLERPSLRGAYEAKVKSIDHNLYVRGNRVFEANYRSGLRILDVGKANQGELSESGFFDVFPPDDEAEFNGAWSTFPYYRSGSVIVSGIEQGLFVLKPTGDSVPTGPGAQDTDSAPSVGKPTPEEEPDSGGGSGGGSAPAPAATAAASATPSPTATAPTAPVACAASSGFRSVSAVRAGRGATLGFQAASSAPVTVDVFQTSRGTRVVNERLVARFSDRTSGVRWNGRANRRGRSVTDGTYFVRYRTRTAAGASETRRLVLRRSNGRFAREPDFYRRATCDLLPSYKLERPVFGGRGTRSLGISYRLARPGRVGVTVLRGDRVVKRFAARSVAAGRTYRLRLSARGLGRGEYRVRLSGQAAQGGESVASTLTARRL